MELSVPLLLDPRLLEVKPMGCRLRDFAHSDHGSLDASHVWRVPGTLNWPNAKKVAECRAREPQLANAIQPWDATRTTLAGLDQALPALPPADEHTTKSPVANPAAGGEMSAEVQQVFVLLRKKLQEDIAAPTTAGQRSDRHYAVIRRMAERGL